MLSSRIKLSIGGFLVFSALVGLYVLYVSQQNQQQAQQEIMQLQKENEKLKQEQTMLQNSQEALNVERETSLKTFLKDTFQILYNYNNDNYVKRFEQIKDRFEPEVLQKLKGSGEQMQSPKTPVRSEVQEVDVYVTAESPQTVHALVNLKSTFSNKRTTTSQNQLFDLEVKKNGNQWVIYQWTTLGTYEPVSTP